MADFGVGIGQFVWDFRPRLIGFQVNPPSSVRGRRPPPKWRRKCAADSGINDNGVDRQPPGARLPRARLDVPRRPANSCQDLPPSREWNSAASSAPAYTRSGSVSEGSRCQMRLNSQGCCVPSAPLVGAHGAFVAELVALPVGHPVGPQRGPSGLVPGGFHVCRRRRSAG